jgi:RNA polymerase sigma-70 factor, ECF subfamily
MIAHPALPAGECLLARNTRIAGLLGAMQPDIKRFALWLCRDPLAAEEIVQEALLRAWRAADRLREEKSAKAWVLTIVRREHARWCARRRPASVSLEELTEADEEELAVADTLPLEDLRQAIFNLDAAYREPLLLQVLVGLSTQEIADRLGLTQSAVLTRLFRARDQLREHFLGDEPERPGNPRNG